MATKKQTAKQGARWRSLRVSAGRANSDVAAVVAMGQALYVEDPGTRPISGKDIARTLRTLASEPTRGRCVVADVADARTGQRQVVGYALLISFWSNELGGEVCVVDELYVSPGARGAGVGSDLVRGLKDGTLPWFRRAVALELEVTPTNARARALYERLGFAPKKNATLRLLRGTSDKKSPASRSNKAV